MPRPYPQELGNKVTGVHMVGGHTNPATHEQCAQPRSSNVTAVPLIMSSVQTQHSICVVAVTTMSLTGNTCCVALPNVTDRCRDAPS